MRNRQWQGGWAVLHTCKLRFKKINIFPQSHKSTASVWCFCTFLKIKTLAKGLHYILFIEHCLEIHEGLHFAKFDFVRRLEKKKAVLGTTIF